MRSLKLNDIAKNLGIRVYCNNCGAWFDPINETTKIRQNNCSHPPSKQRYKSTIVLPSNGSKRKRKSIVHNTRDLQEVILLGLEFKKNVKANAIAKSERKVNTKPRLLLDCLAMFLDFKNDVNVEVHLKKNISRGAISEFKNHIVKWKKASESIGDNFCQLKVDNISTKNVAAVIKYLSKFSNSTQKKAFGFYNQFYRFLNENGYSVVSPFKGIQVSDGLINEPRALTQFEFNRILVKIKEGTKDDKVRNRSVHYDWLAEAFHFAALTGRRREEFMLAKFSDIHLVNGELCGGYIKLIDSKFTKQNKHKIGSSGRYTKCPIYQELAEFIHQMGYERYKDSERYIVAGDEIKQRNTLANNLTNAFAFYRNKLGMSGRIQLKGLRKNYITRMRNEFGDNANFFTGHKSSRIDMKHYYDDRGIFEKVIEFKLWK